MEQLPVWHYKEEILKMLRRNPVLIVTGETGSGKSTIIPQLILDDFTTREMVFAGKDQADMKVAVTQPRRVAAVSMATHVAEQRGVRLGDQVGFTIRFNNTSGPKTQIRYITDGSLLRELLSLEGKLDKYQVIVLDEAHERSLNTDILFSLTKKHIQALAGEDEDKSKIKFRLLITSATLHTEAFSKFFWDAPVIAVSGRQHTVITHHHPVDSGRYNFDSRRSSRMMGMDMDPRVRVEASVDLAIELHLDEPITDEECNILIFLTGAEECEAASNLCFKKLSNLKEDGIVVGDAVILTLYGALPTEAQKRVFAPPPAHSRKIIFSTNVAETSVTVVGIRFVIDCGCAKVKMYNPTTGAEILQVMPISKSEAVQRAGRAGRTTAGKCIRMYSEKNFEGLDESRAPEIQRIDLSSACLQILGMGLTNVLDFEYIERPKTGALLLALKKLFLLGAIDRDQQITEKGRDMVQLPLAPQLSCCLVTASYADCEHDITIITAMLSSERVWVTPPKSRGDLHDHAQERHKRFYNPSGDHLTLRDIYEDFMDLGESRAFDWCRKNFIHYRALHQAEQIASQLEQAMRDMTRHGTMTNKDDRSSRGKEKRKLEEDVRRAYKGLKRDERTLKCLCEGFFLNAARRARDMRGWVTVQDGLLGTPEQGSALSGRDEEVREWLIFSELVGGGRSQGASCTFRGVSEVEGDWIKPKIAKLPDVDLRRLGRFSDVKRERTKTPEEEEEEEKDSDTEREAKKEAALERYRQRKAAKIGK